MQATSYPAQAGTVNPTQKLYPTGQPLTERAGAATILGENAYALDFHSQTGEDVWSCMDAGTETVKYALEVCHLAGSHIVTHCNCPDHVYRRLRVCKHMVELAVILRGGIRTRRGSVVIAASALEVISARPKTVAEALRDMRQDYQAAAARAVILTAAAAEEAEAQAPRNQDSGPRKVVSGFNPDWLTDWK